MPRDYIEEYRELHKSPLFCKGGAVAPYLKDIGDLIRQTKAKTVLDYGCGKAQFSRGMNYADLWGVSLSMYDPAVDMFSMRPEGRFDGVICTDVLEHVENPEWVIQDIFSYATRFVFLSISCKPADKTFADGTNLHINVHPKEWWLDRIKTNLLLDVRFDVP